MYIIFKVSEFSKLVEEEEKEFDNLWKRKSNEYGEKMKITYDKIKIRQKKELENTKNKFLNINNKRFRASSILLGLR